MNLYRHLHKLSLPPFLKMDTPSTKAENDWPSGGVQLSRASQKQPRFSFNRQDRTNPSTFNGVASPHWQTRESNPPRIFGLNRTQTDGQRRSQTPSSSTPEGHPRIRQTNSGNSRRSRLIVESKLLKSEHDVGLLPVKFQDEDDETFGAHTFTSGIGGLSNIGLDSNPAQQDHSVFITQNVRRRSVHLGGNDEQFNVHRARSVKPEPNLAEYSQPYIGHHDSSTARLRSGSVLGSVLDQSEDDISSIMMRGATDLRNAKVTIEEQVGPSSIVKWSRVSQSSDYPSAQRN